jgi:hypothetical protein
MKAFSEFNKTLTNIILLSFLFDNHFLCCNACWNTLLTLPWPPPTTFKITLFQLPWITKKVGIA